MGLSDQQLHSIHQKLETFRGDLEREQGGLDAATIELSKLLAAHTVDQAAVLTHLDTVLTMENRVRRRQMQLMIQLGAELTPEQRQTAMRLRKASQVDLESRLRAKVARIEQEIRTQSQNGRGPESCFNKCNNFRISWKAGKLLKPKPYSIECSSRLA